MAAVFSKRYALLLMNDSRAGASIDEVMTNNVLEEWRE